MSSEDVDKETEGEEKSEEPSQTFYDKLYRNRKTLAPVVALTLILIATAVLIYPTQPSTQSGGCTSGACAASINQSTASTTPTKEKKVEEGDTVMLAYEIQSENGSTISNNTGEYKIGQGRLPEKVKNAVIGLGENETTDVEIDIPSKITRTAYKDKLKQSLGVNGSLEPGQTYPWRGTTLTIETVNQKAVQISMPNPHPLAGETAVFKVTVKNIKVFEKKEKPKVELFIMSYCPYGDKAEKTMKPVYELLGDKVDWRIHYIVNEKNGKITSLHGAKEVTRDARELCVLKKYGAGKWFEFATKLDNGKAWETAAQEIGVDTQEITSCVEKNKTQMLTEEAQISKEKGATGSPTLFINDMENRVVYQYGKPNTYKEAICKGFKTKPEECSQELQMQSTESQGGGGSCGG